MGNAAKGGKGNNVILNVRTEEIVVHHGRKMTLHIGSIETFPHGYDGLRLWEAGIVLARYIVQNSQLFKDKRVL
jgi:predicted nicotinamide N-methyase